MTMSDTESLLMFGFPLFDEPLGVMGALEVSRGKSNLTCLISQPSNVRILETRKRGTLTLQYKWKQILLDYGIWYSHIIVKHI